MPDLHALLPFFVASAIFACVPGPGMVHAAAQTVTRGRRAGWLSAAGFHLAGFGHILAAALGLAVLLKTVPVVYTAVKLAGAAYLIWLGVRYLADARRPGAMSAGGATCQNPGRVCTPFRDGLLVEALNPKTALFYLAFLPQFTDPAASFPVWAQVIVLGAIVNAVFSMTDVVCIVLSDAVTTRLAETRRAERLARRVGGGVLIAFGVNLAVSRQ